MNDEAYLSRLMDDDLSEEEYLELTQHLTDEGLRTWEQYHLLREVLSGGLPKAVPSLRSRVRKAINE